MEQRLSVDPRPVLSDTNIQRVLIPLIGLKAKKTADGDNKYDDNGD